MFKYGMHTQKGLKASPHIKYWKLHKNQILKNLHYPTNITSILQFSAAP